MTYEVIPPNGNVTLFPDNVVTSVEVANVEMLGSNEPGYPVDGWNGGFVVNGSGTQINKIEVDVVFPQGLFALYEGNRLNTSVTVEFQAREIDDSALPTGAWEPLVLETVTRRTGTPQRLTFGGDLPLGRYEVRGRRVGTRNLNASVASQVVWEAARGFKLSTRNYGAVTLIALKAQATNNLNNNTRSRFNLVATRKLPIWNGSDWNTVAATRSPIWALCDMFRAAYGANIEDTYLDLEVLTALDATLETRGDFFDWTFDQPGTVWKAAEAALRVGRAVPIPQGALISAVRDEPKTLPSAFFNANNIEAGSFREELVLPGFADYDSVEVEYVDPVTWKPETILCTLAGGTTDRPERIRLAGATSRAQAFREGMYLRSTRVRQRSNISFRTGLEGHIPNFGDLVVVTHDVLGVGQGGFVVAYDSGTKEMTLSEKVSFDPVFAHKIILRKDDGSATPAIVATAGSSANKVILATDPPEALTFDIDRDPILFSFGPALVETYYAKLIKILPVDNKTVELKLVNYTDAVFDYDTATVPASTVTQPPALAEEAPDIQNVTVTTLPDQPEIITVSWADKTPYRRRIINYVVELTYDTPVDGSSKWERVGTTRDTKIEIPVRPADLVVRVSAQQFFGRGVWRLTPVKTVGISGTVPASPVLNATQAAFDGLTASVAFQPAANADGYSVDVYKTGGALLRQTDVLFDLLYEYTFTDMEEDAPGAPSRNLTFKVKGYNGAGASDTADLDVTNPPPAAPTSPASVLDSGDDYTVTVAAIAGPPADFDNYRFYASTTPGFTPGPGNLVGSGATPSATVNAPVTTYWRAAYFDVWASDDSDANFTAEQTITI